jgi:hypothetical protein
VDVVLPEVAPLDADLMYLEHPIKILDQKDCVVLPEVKFFKIEWSNHTEEEATWESEEFLHSRHPDFALPQRGNVRLFAVPARVFPNLGVIFLVRGEAVTPLVLVKVISANPSH